MKYFPYIFISVAIGINTGAATNSLHWCFASFMVAIIFSLGVIDVVTAIKNK